MDPAREQTVRAELVRTQREARLAIHRGVALIAVVALVLIGAVIAAFALGGFGGFLAILLAATYLLVGSIAGVAGIVGGLSDHRRCARQLREIDAVYQLPEARVVRR